MCQGGILHKIFIKIKLIFNIIYTYINNIEICIVYYQIYFDNCYCHAIITISKNYKYNLFINC